MLMSVVDRAVQAHGGAGLNSDFPLANFYIYARSGRLFDGPDEVHLRAISRYEVAKFKQMELLTRINILLLHMLHARMVVFGYFIYYSPFH